MKKWNFFARALCVLTLIIFASCNYAGDNSGSNPPETPPADVTNLTDIFSRNYRPPLS